MIIAFMGNDGSGKTTLAKEVVKMLKTLGMEVHYRVEFDYFLLSHFLRLLGKEKVSRARKVFLAKEGKECKRFYFKVWPYIVWLDLFLEWLWNKLFKRKSIIVMDRYAYDFLMSWEWLGYANAYLRWLYNHFPKPDIGFILDVSPQTAYIRKRKTHAYPLYYYKIQRKRYLSLAETLKLRVIDTEKTVEECLNEIFMEFRRYFIMKLSDEDKVLLFYSSPKFNPFILQELNLTFNWSVLNWDYIIDMAVKCNTENVLCTNLLRYHGSQLPKSVSSFLTYVLEKSNERVNLLVETLRALSKKLSEERIEFLVIKTIAPFDYGATDVDVLVRREDFKRAQYALSSIFKLSRNSVMHKAVTYQKALLLPVDLHYEISWLGFKVIDEERVFMRKRKVLYKNIELFVPSQEDELLILSAHSLFQHHYTTIGEFLQIVELVSKRDVDKEYILSSSAKYGWQKLLQSFLSYLLWKYYIIYGNYYSFSKYKEMTFALNIDPINFHPFQSIPKKSVKQILDLLLSFYRLLRFRLSGQLAYNINWLRNSQRQVPQHPYKQNTTTIL
jgi:thymidylate kinase